MTSPFARWGHPRAELLGRGMEGVVYRLGGGLVGKVWQHRTPDELERLRAFYAELATRRLPYATPLIEAVHADGEIVATVERELPGTPLLTSKVPEEAAHDAVVTVVTALAGTTAGPATRALPLLDEGPPPRDADWLADLVTRRVHRHHDVLAAAVPRLAETADRVTELLVELPESDQIVHGDICQENLMVDRAGRLVAVLDWGFLTTAGDNAFDASTAAAFFDMYGPDARRHDDALTDRFVALGHDRRRLLVYRAAYALAAATAYHDDGRDGHFAWCMATLRRPDVQDALDR